MKNPPAYMQKQLAETMNVAKGNKVAKGPALNANPVASEIKRQNAIMRAAMKVKRQ